MEPVRIEKVLAAVDFSDWTPAVLQTAALMARQHEAGVVAVYAELFLPPPYFTERGTEAMKEFLEAQRQAAQRHLAGLAARQVGSGVDLATRVVEAAPAEGILTAAEEAKAGLIVLGTHGRSGLNRLLLGSVAEKVVRQARVPVLSVRGQRPESGGAMPPFRRILCPVNFTPVALDALRWAVDLARRGGAELVLLTAIEEGPETDPDAIRVHEERLCATLPAAARAHCAFRPLVRAGDPAEQILKAAAGEGCDLIVLGAQHRPLLETTIIGTTSARVMRHATCPVLTVTRH
jgi:nucleotide-binding universal stress UspA family protein